MDLNNLSHDDNNFDYDDPETIIHVRLLLGVIDISNTRHVKKKISKESMPVAWYPDSGIEICQKMKKKK